MVYSSYFFKILFLIILSVRVITKFYYFCTLLSIHHKDNLMTINYNQLLKSLEIGSDHFKVFICFLCSTLVLYPLLFVSLPFLRDISIYQQLLFVSGCSVIYTGLGILFSAPAIKYPGMFYLPILVLGCISVVFYIKKVLQSSDSMLIMLLILLISTYSCLFVGGIIAVVVKTKKSKKSKPIPKKEISH